jgi:type I restriction enzyme S subunit
MIARFVNGKAFTKGATGTGRVVVRIAELNSGLGGSTVYNDIDVPEDHVARPGDLLFAWSGSLTVARWFRPEAIVNQHIFKVIPHDGYPMWMVNQALRTKLDEFKAIAADKATTMGHIQRRHLDEPVTVPSEEEVERLDPLMCGLWDWALAAESENLRLAKTRDELLPLLMSGKLRVRDAEEVVGDAV